jgi:hypothetical protein
MGYGCLSSVFKRITDNWHVRGFFAPDLGMATEMRTNEPYVRWLGAAMTFVVMMRLATTRETCRELICKKSHTSERETAQQCIFRLHNLYLWYITLSKQKRKQAQKSRGAQRPHTRQTFTLIRKHGQRKHSVPHACMLRPA